MNRMHILALGITAAMSGSLCLSNTGSTGAKSAAAGPGGWDRRTWGLGRREYDRPKPRVRTQETNRRPRSKTTPDEPVLLR